MNKIILIFFKLNFIKKEVKKIAIKVKKIAVRSPEIIIRKKADIKIAL